MNDVRIISAGVEYSGFKTATIKRGINSISGTFSLGVTEKEVSEEFFYLISPGDQTTVTLNNEPVIQGYIDSRNIVLNKTNKSVNVKGRDKSGDLVDCSSEYGTFTGLSYLNLANKLASPYGVVFTKSSTKKLDIIDLKVDPGATVFEILEKQARKFGVLLISDGLGSVDIADPGVINSGTTLIEGENILELSVDINLSGIFKDYKLLGQTQGNDSLNGVSASEIEANSKDELIKRNRRLTILADENVTPAQAQKRVEWESTVRRAKARTVQVKVPTWMKADGKIWKPNELVRVESPSTYVSGIFLIKECTYSKDALQSSTILSIVSKNSYRPEPLIVDDAPDGLNFLNGGD